jgi:hypothetical protein
MSDQGRALAERGAELGKLRPAWLRLLFNYPRYKGGFGIYYFN